MVKTIWAIKREEYGTNALEELLYEKWEPFDVTEVSQPYVVWLRKIVRVEVKDEAK